MFLEEFVCLSSLQVYWHEAVHIIYIPNASTSTSPFAVLILFICTILIFLIILT